MAETYAPAHSAAVATRGTVRRVSWGAIIAGSVVTVALMILFTTFGVGIGTAIFDPQYDENPGSGFGTGSAIYLVVTQLIALGAGGYIAARLAGIPRPLTAVLHGAAVWAVATVFLAWAAVAGGGAMFGAASSVIGSSASAVSSIGKAIVPDDLSLPDPSRLAGSISIDNLPEELQTTLREQGVTQANIRREATAAFRNVFSQQEQEAALAEARSTLRDILQSPRDIGEDLSAFFDRLVTGPDAILSEEDLQQAQTVMQQRLGITPEEAQRVVQSVQNGVQEAIEETRETIEEARASAVEAAQAASAAISKLALLLSLASVLGLAAACGGAFGGKPESLVGDRVDDHV